jgi:hypothetical protein
MPWHVTFSNVLRTLGVGMTQGTLIVPVAWKSVVFRIRPLRRNPSHPGNRRNENCGSCAYRNV